MPITKHERGLGELIAGEAYRAFDRWLAEHDPDGKMSLADAAVAYSNWSDTNSTAKYMDAANAPND